MDNKANWSNDIPLLNYLPNEELAFPVAAEQNVIVVDESEADNHKKVTSSLNISPEELAELAGWEVDKGKVTVARTYTSDGWAARSWDIDEQFPTKVRKQGESDSPSLSNEFWWMSRDGSVSKHLFFVYTEDHKLAKKIQRNEKVKPAIYYCCNEDAAFIFGWQFVLKRGSSVHFNKIMRWCGFPELPKKPRSPKQKKVTEKARPIRPPKKKK